MATIIDSIDSIIREELSPSVTDLLPKIDPVSQKFVRDEFSATREGIGRDWKVYHEFFTSVGGAFEWKAATGGDLATGPTTSNVYDTPRNFPTYSEAPNVGSTSRYLTLVQGAGTMVLPIQLFQTDQLSAMVTKYISKAIQGVARNVANYQVISLFKADSYSSIAHIDGSITNGTTGDDDATFAVDGGRIRQFYEGMLVDIFDSSGANQRNSTDYCIVDSVDRLNKTIKVQLIGSSPTFDVNLADDDIIVPRASKSLGPSGWEDWIVDSGSLYNMSLTTYPQLKSYLATSVGSLDEWALSSYIGAFDDAYGTLVELDTILTTGGVTREYLEQTGSFSAYQRQGAALNMQGGWSDIGYMYNGRKMDWMISQNCPSGVMYIIKTGDGNLKEYVPPRIPSAGTKEGFAGDIQFLAPLAGSSSIFLPARGASGEATELVEAPFFCFKERAPEMPQSIKLSGCTES
jgi:hypothetical protein